jgi:hypothetical protein
MPRLTWHEFKLRTSGLARHDTAAPPKGASVVAEASDARSADWALWECQDGRRMVAPLTTRNKWKASTSFWAKLALDLTDEER